MYTSNSILVHAASARRCSIGRLTRALIRGYWGQVDEDGGRVEQAAWAVLALEHPQLAELDVKLHPPTCVAENVSRMKRSKEK